MMQLASRPWRKKKPPLKRGRILSKDGLVRWTGDAETSRARLFTFAGGSSPLLNPTTDNSSSKRSLPPVRLPDTPDRDATAADLQPDAVLASMIRAIRRGDRRSAGQDRRYLRQCGLSVTIARLDPYTQAGQVGYMFDRLLEAMAAGDYRPAAAHRNGLAREGVIAVPLPPKERGASR